MKNNTILYIAIIAVAVAFILFTFKCNKDQIKDTTDIIKEVIYRDTGSTKYILRDSIVYKTEYIPKVKIVTLRDTVRQYLFKTIGIQTGDSAYWYTDTVVNPEFTMVRNTVSAGEILKYDYKITLTPVLGQFKTGYWVGGNILPQNKMALVGLGIERKSITYSGGVVLGEKGFYVGASYKIK